MRYLDLVIQSLIFIFGITALIWFSGDSAWPVNALLIAQLILGPWQMLSSFASAILRAGFHKAKRLHLIVSTIYLITLYVFFNWSPPIFNHNDVIPKILLTVPAWSLAFFYYIVTWKWVLTHKRKRGSFLPNLSF
jgi:hypothetical protein